MRSEVGVRCTKPAEARCSKYCPTNQMRLVRFIYDKTARAVGTGDSTVKQSHGRRASPSLCGTFTWQRTIQCVDGAQIPISYLPRTEGSLWAGQRGLEGIQGRQLDREI